MELFTNQIQTEWVCLTDLWHGESADQSVHL